MSSARWTAADPPGIEDKQKISGARQQAREEEGAAANSLQARNIGLSTASHLSSSARAAASVALAASWGNPFRVMAARRRSHRLMDDTRLPLDWNEQWQRLGFESVH